MLQEVVAKGKNHQQDQENHARILGRHQKAFAQGFAGYHFYEQKDHMPPVQGRNGE